MKTFDQFITEARISTKRRVLRNLGRKAKQLGSIAMNSKPAQAAKKYVGATAGGAAATIALKLLTGL